MKIRPVESELFHADGRTDRRKDRHDEVKSRFSQLCEKRPKSVRNILGPRAPFRTAGLR